MRVNARRMQRWFAPDRFRRARKVLAVETMSLR
jgi:hypothetical protein